MKTEGIDIEKLLDTAYWIIDILPEQVPADSAGQYFAVEQYFLSADRKKMIHQKYADIFLKLNCYYDLLVSEDYGENWEKNPDPERLVLTVTGGNPTREVYVLLEEENALIILDKTDTNMTVYNAQDILLKRIKALVSGEGLYIWQPADISAEKKTIHVAAAVIIGGDRIFATQRGYGDWKDYWEFPGGKIEPGETPEAALHREILEELDTEIAVGGKIATIEYEYPEFHLCMECFFARVIRGSLVLKEHESSKWLRQNELNTVNWLPADELLIRQLKL